MGVYIKGMEMPKSCWGCDVGPAFQVENKSCPFYEMEGWEQENYQDKIAEGCPISYVPPHGDLIDAFAFRREMDAHYPFDKFTQSKHGEADAAKSTILRMLAKAPTIIEAEE